MRGSSSVGAEAPSPSFSAIFALSMSRMLGFLPESSFSAGFSAALISLLASRKSARLKNMILTLRRALIQSAASVILSATFSMAFMSSTSFLSADFMSAGSFR